MADTKASALTELAERPAISDEFVVVDKSDTTMAASGTDKRLKASWLAPMIVVRTADRAAIVSQTTPQSDGVLLFPITGNSTQILFVELFASVNTANNTMDIKHGFSLPSGATMRWGLGFVAGAAFPGFFAAAAAAAPTAVLTEASTISLGGINGGKNFVGASGWVFSGASAGDVNWQVAQDTSNGSNLIVEKGSFLRVYQLVA